jgi:hypothetical protein
MPAQALKEALGIEELPALNIAKTDGEEEKEAALFLLRGAGCRGITQLVQEIEPE